MAKLEYFTDVTTGRTVAINARHVICVFQPEANANGINTVISTSAGNIPVAASQLEVVAQLNNS
jgi:hypothetical protein